MTKLIDVSELRFEDLPKMRNIVHETKEEGLKIDDHLLSRFQQDVEFSCKKIIRKVINDELSSKRILFDIDHSPLIDYLHTCGRLGVKDVPSIDGDYTKRHKTRTGITHCPYTHYIDVIQQHGDDISRALSKYKKRQSKVRDLHDTLIKHNFIGYINGLYDNFKTEFKEDLNNEQLYFIEQDSDDMYYANKYFGVCIEYKLRSKFSQSYSLKCKYKEKPDADKTFFKDIIFTSSIFSSTNKFHDYQFINVVKDLFERRRKWTEHFNKIARSDFMGSITDSILDDLRTYVFYNKLN